MKKHEKTCRKTAELISHRGQNDVIISGKEHRRRQAGASFFQTRHFHAQTIRLPLELLLFVQCSLIFYECTASYGLYGVIRPIQNQNVTVETIYLRACRSIRKYMPINLFHRKR